MFRLLGSLFGGRLDAFFLALNFCMSIVFLTLRLFFDQDSLYPVLFCLLYFKDGE